MLIELISRYYKLFWFALAAISFLKIILSYSFHEDLQGFSGILYSLFKWFGEQEQEMEDIASRRTMMRFQNVVTSFIYVTLLVIIVVTFLPKILGR